MDLMPEELRKVTFSGAKRGYSTPEVDEFVEKVAAGIGELLEQLKSASERAARAEAALAEARPSDETIQRTLLHAQKLADAVLAEARQEASAVAAEAAEQASKLRAKAREEGGAHVAKAREARAEAERLRAESAADRARARSEVDALLAKASEGIDADVRAEVERLHALRTSLEADVSALQTWLEEQRGQLRRLLSSALEAVDGSPLPIAEPPPVEPVDTRPRFLQSMEIDEPAGEEAASAPRRVSDERPTESVRTVPDGDEAFAPERRPATSRGDEDLLAELRAARRSDNPGPLPGDPPRRGTP